MMKFNVLLLPLRSGPQVLYKLHWDHCFAQHQSSNHVSAVTLTLDTNMRQPSKSNMKNGALIQSSMGNFKMLNCI